MKDDLRFVIEATLNRMRESKALSLQALLRGKLARNVAKRRKNARSVI